MLLQVFLLLLSLVLLYYGAELALNSAEKVGRALGFSPLVIGLVIVGFGTSLPELFVSQLASYRGEYPLALGNIVGSNVANLFLILGIAGVLAKLDLSHRDVRDQLVIHIILTLCLVGVLTREFHGPITMGVLLCFFAVYLFLTYLDMRKKMDGENTHKSGEKISWRHFAVLNLGFLLLYGGGELLVISGSTLGEMFGVSTFIISAIFVAFGTSFPELVTAVMSCVKKKDLDLITGNIIGSNIFNGSLILGSLGIYNMPLEISFQKEFIALGIASVVLLGLSLGKLHFGRVMGVLFLGGYGVMIYFWVTQGA